VLSELVRHAIGEAAIAPLQIMAPASAGAGSAALTAFKTLAQQGFQALRVTSC